MLFVQFGRKKENGLLKNVLIQLVRHKRETKGECGLLESNCPSRLLLQLVGQLLLSASFREAWTLLQRVQSYKLKGVLD
ncbi:hypothetical protein RRG08_023226 [Elysia crispata]|uniref:Uncharacterized protein n=1 Tax=Elysia crispata TaxID=231223 RepID=A0AAE0ZQS9_9GAST|nr:hypothetical protein RRG08_023226 [Elysia crispata]